MCLNDILCHGADPLFFLDYYASSKVDKTSFLQIIKSITEACKQNDCSLIGGETAEMPGLYKENDFDFAGFCVGAVERNNLLPKHSLMKKGDLLFGIHSSGFHSNGYSLVRNIMSKRKINIKKNSFLKNELIKPTKIYVKEVLNLIDKKLLNGCANITGGGLPDNIKRIIPERYCAEIDLNKIKTKNQFVNSVLHFFGFIKFPAPTIEINNGKLIFHPIYF